jgi:hypothetical protein
MRELMRIFTVSMVGLLAAGCVSDRYVGSVGPGGLYANRGYGFALRLHDSGLDSRWLLIDPANVDAAPRNRRPIVHDEPIDLDGNGNLDIGETTRYFTPTLRLLSKTSTYAEITLDVGIVHPKNKKSPIEDFVIPEVRELAHTSSITGPLEARVVSDTWETRVAETPPVLVMTAHNVRQPMAYRLALIDQNDFVAEENIKRRQIVRVVLRAPEITPTLRDDFDQFLRALILNRVAGETTNQERW